MSDFTRKAERIIKSGAEKSIRDLLKALDSEIKPPMLQDGKTVNEPKLLSVIKGREEAFNSVKAIMDELEMDRNNDKKMVSLICRSLETTFYEIEKIVTRDIRPDIIEQSEDDIDEDDDASDKKKKPRELTDDYFTAISKTKKEGIFLQIKIYKTILSLEDKDKLYQEKLKKAPMVSITERFANNGR